MKTEKKKRGRPPKHKAMEFEGMTYEGAINHALDKEVRADLDKCLADKDESQLTDDERKNYPAYPRKNTNRDKCGTCYQSQLSVHQLT